MDDTATPFSRTRIQDTWHRTVRYSSAQRPSSNLDLAFDYRPDPGLLRAHPDPSQKSNPCSRNTSSFVCGRAISARSGRFCVDHHQSTLHNPDAERAQHSPSPGTRAGASSTAARSSRRRTTPEGRVRSGSARSPLGARQCSGLRAVICSDTAERRSAIGEVLTSYADIVYRAGIGRPKLQSFAVCPECFFRLVPVRQGRSKSIP